MVAQIQADRQMLSQNIYTETVLCQNPRKFAVVLVPQIVLVGLKGKVSENFEKFEDF